ncbi:gliding motility-associated C-terminal domain-containing protein [Paracrocinitomix mangrovi]|uniref:T9SS type B sorting domain-containing protein n=1 Tax=Paracrocinitomix mangrovi TaxID=2862509 RepID=UPI001C8F128D|nr:gliding motility-associated C-terminal domain-containing protein [Paracrocinitomix mangrovi]UKN01808.1 gliding motility-associated C-terminal domain-containing protein [Paracrocinitomix mangrovi]
MRTKLLFILLFVLSFANVGKATHIMGGEITWVCLGSGQYQFDLILYRDCNGLDIVDPTLDIEVWGHPTVSTIQCDLVTTIDLSPNCTEVTGGPAELDCGIGSQGGNGPGAVQKFIYQSNAVTLSGTPPSTGWKFTYDSFSRNWDLTNIQDPFNYGITLSAYMYDTGSGNANPCTDSSPQFAQEPYIVICQGTDVQFNSNAYDPDNDSLVFSWGIPLNDFNSGTFDPPTNPAPVPFELGFAYNNPTPDASFDPGNIPATMDPVSGDINFLSNTIGNFGIVQKIDSYRNGELISTIHREIQMIIIPCPGYNNTAPDITPPFAGNTSFEATFYAGDLINFDIIINDLEFLQDGTPQTVILDPSGNYFGTNLTNPNSGCDYTPCATLDQPPIITGVQGLTTTFNWQTSCDHLLDSDGNQQQSQTYDFVLNAQDDYCQVPGRTYETIRITLLNQAEVEPVDLHCVDVLPNGDVELTWTQTTDPGSSFIQYEVWSVQDGFIAAIPTITTENYTVLGANADLGSKDYFIQTKWGCAGNNLSSSDTLSSIFLNLNDLGDGRIHLTWNSTHDPMNAGDNAMEEIWREYPVGTWTLRGTVPYGTNQLVDTIDVCNDQLTYEIVVANSAGCSSTSNNPSGMFQDIINPIIPEIYWVSIDTTNDFVQICWDQNDAPDTYGYVIYGLVSGFWTELDTTWGIGTTCYTYTATNSMNEPESFRVTAFDSCFTNAFPPTYQTSALSNPHTTIYLEDVYDVCEKSVTLNWTPYEGWDVGVNRYDIIVKAGNSTFDIVATVDGNVTSWTHENLGYDLNYCYYVRAVSNDDTISYSNLNCRFISKPSQASFHYLAAASHTLGGDIEVRTYTDGTAAVEEYEIEVKGPDDNQFSVVNTMGPIATDWLYYTDTDVFPDRGAYQYKVGIVDSCGNIGDETNIARTVFLQIDVDDVEMINTLSWSSYVGFDGNILEYRIYRGEDGIFPSTPIGTTNPALRSFTDDVSAMFESEGQFCYRVEAVEDTNSYGFAETAFSNTACATFDPVVYIPNAFIVNGENPVFLPVIALYEFDSYQLTIYDRWGREVFTTTDSNEGWAGYGPGNGLVQEGVYVYQLTFEDRDAQEYVYRGSVTMLVDKY